MPDAANFAAVLLRLGNWRYFLTGLALLLLIVLWLRAFGKLLEPFAKWRIFRGICTETDGSGALTVTFTDAHRLRHTAAFRSDEPEAASLHPGDRVRIALRTEIYISGEYPAEIGNAAQAGRDILLRSEQQRILRAELLRTLAVQLLICGAVLTVFLITKRFCFPPHN
ncbi:MAG: hypothetical protein IKI58_02615 [Oscillospiraceae bacterium]|nr:hypothetical protein [Oscillospiraceae bacterium]